MKHGYDNMYWEELIHNFAVLLHVDEGTAGTVVAFTLISSIILSIYIVTRGSVSNSKTWITVSLVIQIVLFTYPFEWIPLWYGMIMVLAISITSGYAISKTAGGE